MQAPLKSGSGIMRTHTKSGKPIPPKKPIVSPYKRSGSSIGSLYYDDMSIKYLGRIDCGKKSGPGKEFHNNGTLYFDGNYQNDQPHGDQLTLWHDNKETMFTGSMNEGRKEGNGTEYYHNGQVLFHGSWHNNEPYGEAIKILNQDGSVMFEGNKTKGGDEANVETEEGQKLISETTTTKVTDDGIDTTKTTITSEVMSKDVMHHEETVKITETVQTVHEDKEGNITEVDTIVTTEVDGVDTQTGIAHCEDQDVREEVVIPIDGEHVQVTTTDTHQFVHEEANGESHIDVVKTSEVDLVDTNTGETIVESKEETQEVIGDHTHITETITTTEDGETKVTETVTENEDGRVTTETKTETVEG